MDRKRLEQELSLYLDGRLPTGRRERLLEHVSEDLEAARLLTAMRAASDAARSLTPERVGPDFTRDLWERIRSGEGTPEAVFREPIAPLTKLRYLLSGAAAAAACLVALSWLSREVPPTQGSNEQAIVAKSAPTEPASTLPLKDPMASMMVASADPTVPTTRERSPDAERSRRGTPLHARGSNFDAQAPEVLMPLDAYSVAKAGVTECVGAIADLKRELPTIATSLTRGTDVQTIAGSLEPAVERARESIQVVRWLQREQVVNVRPKFDANLMLVEQILARLEQTSEDHDVNFLKFAAESLGKLELEESGQAVEVVCCGDSREFRVRFRDHFASRPESLRWFRMEAIGGSTHGFRLVTPGTAQDPFDGAVLRIQVTDR
ncbi:MAG: anti-sigma factor [Planctomycetota bacterium]